MEGDHIKIWHWLTPLSWLYGMAVTLRNIMFDCGALRSESFDLPVISVGNITVGGTGKTPHTEYLVKLLKEKYQVAILSRGYKRKTRGFRLAKPNTKMSEIGDEPFQMKRKFPEIHMAVDKNRCHGIKQLCKPNVRPLVDVIILDDAYQHRYVTPGINILLMDYHRLIYFDQLLPAGRLREPRTSSRRADIVIVTKCPLNITPMEERGIARSLDLQPWQQLFFTTFRYGSLVSYDQYTHSKNAAVAPEIPLESLNGQDYNVILLTGIASPEQMEYDLKKHCSFTPVHFPDHHAFTANDIKTVKYAVEQNKSENKRTIIVTTEKDAARLTDYFRYSSSDEHTIGGAPIYILPIEVSFMDSKEETFNKFILNYVLKNSRNSTLLKGKNDN